MNRTSSVFFSIALAVLAGLGCGERVKPAPRILEFTVTPAALPPGGGPVEARWKVEQARQVFLEIDGERREVAAEGSLSLSIADTTKFVLLATDFDADRKEITVPVEHISVSGVVLDPTGATVAGIEVRVNGGESILSDAEGRFTAADVRVPYSVRLHAPEGDRTEQLWLGLKRTEIKLLVPGPYVERPLPASYVFRITWNGGGVTAPPGASPFTHLLVFSADASGENYVSGAPGAGSATIDAYLDGPASRDVTVIVLQGYMEDYVEGQWIMTRVIYQRASPATTVSADSATVTDVPAITLEPVETTLHPIQVVADSWLKMSSVRAQAELPGMAPLESFLWWGVASYSRSFAFPVPPIPGSAILLNVNGYPSDDRGARVAQTRYLPLSGSGPLVVPLTVPPDLVLPMDNEAFAGQMIWSRRSPGPCRVNLNAGDGEVDIHTDGRELTLADLETAGYALKDPFGYSRGSWQVACPEGFASLDEVMADLPRYAAAFDWNSSTGVGWSDPFDFYVP